MSEEELKKTLFVLTIAKNRLKNEDFNAYFSEIEAYIMKALSQNE